MSAAEMVTHTEKAVIRTADGRIASLEEHSWEEPKTEHIKHRSSNNEALAARERAVEQKTHLGTQVAELRGRLIEVQEQLAGRTEALHHEQRLRTDVEAKLQGRESQVRSFQKKLAADAQVVADAQIALKNIPSPVTPVTMVAPRELNQLAVDYIADLVDLERQIAELEGSATAVHWVIPPDTDAAPASEATS